MKLYYFATLLAVITACSTKNTTLKDTKKKGLSETGVEANLESANAYNLITVEIGATKEQMAVTEDHLYGKFFEDRAEFFIIEKPDLYVSDALVNRLTLYFIDGTLCKKKYELETDISSELMKSYGGFKFLALNDTTQKLSKSEKIIYKTPEGTQINENFSRYQMKWTENDIDIKYVVVKDSTAGQLELVEELIAYKQLLRAAELEI